MSGSLSRLAFTVSSASRSESMAGLQVEIRIRHHQCPTWKRLLSGPTENPESDTSKNEED
jgi:hypothetical protein